MTDLLLLAHWLITLFLLLIWCIEKSAARWTGYRFIYLLYALLPVAFFASWALREANTYYQIPLIVTGLANVAQESMPPVPSNSANLLLYIWGTGVVLTLVPLARQWLCVSRLQGIPLLVHGFPALISSAVDSPCLKGVFRPVILLPMDYRDTFDEQQLRWVIAHERVHAQRQDNLWNLFALGLRTLFWFNPLLWLGYRHFRMMQEISCDEIVLSGQPRTSAIAYARTLLAASTRLTTNTSQHPLCTHYGDKEMMMKRMQFIQCASQVNRTAQRLLLCAALCACGALSAIAAGNSPEDTAAPERVHTVLPEYPVEAMQSMVEADVVLEYEIHPTEGNPIDIRVVKNTAPEEYRAAFDTATIEMAEQWRYRPTGKLQRNVRTLTRYRVTDGE